MVTPYASWLDKMKQAWETKDFEVLSTMFPDNVTYFESPFLPPLLSKQQVIEQWKKDVEKQRDIKVSYTILREDENGCFANWSASFVREGKLVNLDGIFYFKLDVGGTCGFFKQWWVVKEA